MKYQIWQRAFFILIALFMVVSGLFLVGEDAGQAKLIEPVKPQKIRPYFLSAGQITDEENCELIFYPNNPAPGDFIIIEAGPLVTDVQPRLEFDFAGTISEYYQLGNMLYAIAAIYYETEPGSYNLELIKNFGQSEEILTANEIVIAEKDFHFSRFSMPASRTAGWTAERLAEDREKIRLARENTEFYPLWQGSFINPVEGRISSTYGAIRVINQNPPRRHSGLDVAVEEGTPVFATNRGIVRLSESLLAGGETIIIDHGLDFSSTYMHLHKTSVEEGVMVERGDKIGTVGMTGYATGPHLHWEVNIGQTPVNPEQLFDNELLLIPPAYVKKKAESWQ
ncbi:MAG: M23 family metallopeptidase [Bacillota bacterium]